MNLMGGSKDENAAIEDDIKRTITARVREFISLNPGIEQDPGRISQYADKVKTESSTTSTTRRLSPRARY